MHLDEFLTWKYHIEKVRKTLTSASKDFISQLYNKEHIQLLIKSHLEYGLICWGGVKPSKLHWLLMLQKKVIGHIAGKGIIFLLHLICYDAMMLVCCFGLLLLTFFFFYSSIFKNFSLYLKK